MRKPDRLLRELNAEWEREKDSFQLGGVFYPATRHRTVDLLPGSRDLGLYPLGLYRVLKGGAA